MQYKVPQNIDLEDKIIGPLTMIQFLYLLIGGVIDYLLLTYLKGGVVFWILAIPIAVIALSLTFIKIQDQPLSHFVKAGIAYLRSPKIRLWRRNGLAVEYIQAKEIKKKVIPPPPKRRIEKSELEKLSQMLDTQRVSAGNPK
ncbi:MAG: hypothetical protein HW405_52 [Candidatus Berkelbacteria bacterium]|nr:hypothetical protein [Candidatus Berkelbacteria bacterium]